MILNLITNQLGLKSVKYNTMSRDQLAMRLSQTRAGTQTRSQSPFLSDALPVWKPPASISNTSTKYP